MANKRRRPTQTRSVGRTFKGQVIAGRDGGAGLLTQTVQHGEAGGAAVGAGTANTGVAAEVTPAAPAALGGDALPSRSWRRRHAPRPNAPGGVGIAAAHGSNGTGLPTISLGASSSVASKNSTPLALKVGGTPTGPTPPSHAHGSAPMRPHHGPVAGGVTLPPVKGATPPPPAAVTMATATALQQPCMHPTAPAPTPSVGSGAGEARPTHHHAHRRASSVDDFNTKPILLREILDVEKNLDEIALCRWRVRPGVPNVVHRLFHKMQCKSTQFYKEVKDTADLVGMQARVREVLSTKRAITRESLPVVLTQIFPKVKRVTSSDAELLFNFLDVDNHGDVEEAEISNGLVLLLVDDIVALLQRCRLLVLSSPQQNLMLITRYEMQLLIGALLTAYKQHVEYSLMQDELTGLMAALDFSMRGRVEMSVLRAHLDRHNGRIRRWFEDALDHYAQTGNPQLSNITFHLQTAASLTEEERTFTSRKEAANQHAVPRSPRPDRSGRAGALNTTGGGAAGGRLPVDDKDLDPADRPADVYAVDDERLQRSLLPPKHAKEEYEGLRGDKWVRCRFVDVYDPTAASHTVEWEDGYISSVPADRLRSCQDCRKEKSSSLTTLVGLINVLKRAGQSPASARLAPMAPLKERLKQKQFTEAGFVDMPAVFQRKSSLRLAKLAPSVRKVVGPPGDAPAATARAGAGSGLSLSPTSPPGSLPHPPAAAPHDASTSTTTLPSSSTVPVPGLAREPLKQLAL